MATHIEVWGDYALFTRPELKVERVSYEVMTPSAARGKMAVRELIVFKHDSPMGCAPAWKLFDLVKVTRKNPDDPAPARAYSDYMITVEEDSLPAGVTCNRME